MANILETYREMKAKYPDRMLIFVGGENYQMLNGDARTAAPILGLRYAYFRNDPDTGTCVFKREDLDWVLPKLIRAGYRVGLVEG